MFALTHDAKRRENHGQSTAAKACDPKAAQEPSKDQIVALYKSTMEVIRQDVQIEGCTAHLKEKIPPSRFLDLSECSYMDKAEMQAWQVYAILADRHQRLDTWVREQLRHEQPSRDTDDPWHAIFDLVAMGRHLEASNAAQALGDISLGTVLTLCQIDNVWPTAERQIQRWQDTSTWQTMTPYQRRIWRALNGQLGYDATTKTVTTQGLAWLPTFGLYLFHGRRVGQGIDRALTAYLNAVGDRRPGLHHLYTRRDTATPSDQCAWFNLVRWWIHDQTQSHLGRSRSTLQHALPLRLAWVLAIQDPDRFFDADTWTMAWCDALCRVDLASAALLAALFHSRPESTIKGILLEAGCDDPSLLETYHIPTSWLDEHKFLQDTRAMVREMPAKIRQASKAPQRDALRSQLLSTLDRLGELVDRYPDQRQSLALLASECITAAATFDDESMTQQMLAACVPRLAPSAALTKAMSRALLASFVRSQSNSPTP